MKIVRHLNFLRSIALSLSIVIIVLYSAAVSAAPISFNSALPVSQGERIVRALVNIDRQSASSDEEQVERDQQSLVSVLGYGINAKWSVFGVIPLQHVSTSSNNQTQRNTALGDVEVFSRYEVWRADRQGSTYRVAPFSGARLPSGELGISSDGTTDVFAGLIFSAANIEQNFDLQLRYERNGNNAEFSAGDTASADFSWQKRIAPNKISGDTKGFWFAALEAELNFMERDRLSGSTLENSGGFRASISPGIQYITRRWIAEMAIRIPIINKPNGNAPESEYTVFTGIRANF